MVAKHCILLHVKNTLLKDEILHLVLSICKIYDSDLMVFFDYLDQDKHLLDIDSAKLKIETNLKQIGMANRVNLYFPFKYINNDAVQLKEGRILSFDLIIYSIEEQLEMPDSPFTGIQQLKYKTKKPILTIPENFDIQKTKTCYYLLEYEIEDIVAVNVLFRLQSSLKFDIVLLDLNVENKNIEYRKMLRKNFVQMCYLSSNMRKLNVRSMNLIEFRNIQLEYFENSLFVMHENRLNKAYVALVENTTNSILASSGILELNLSAQNYNSKILDIKTIPK